MLCETPKTAALFCGLSVLILVLMEYALRVLTKMSLTMRFSRLNPCFNGICSASYYSAFNNSGIDVLILVLMEYALRVNLVQSTYLNKDVLILVLMEYALREQLLLLKSRMNRVLILVLMEYALRGKCSVMTTDGKQCLNPCFNGICSARQQGRTQRCC